MILELFDISLPLRLICIFGLLSQSFIDHSSNRRFFSIHDPKDTFRENPVFKTKLVSKLPKVKASSGLRTNVVFLSQLVQIIMYTLISV